MSGEFAHISRCLDLQEQDVAEAIATREQTKSLLLHLSELSAPNTGAAKVLLLLARMATTACAWLDGDLGIDLVGDADVTVVEVSTELGGGLRERVFGSIPLRAPLKEFARAIDRVPHMIAPLTIRAKSARRISLAASDLVRRTTMPPPPVEISSESLFIRVLPPALPSERGDAGGGLPLPVVAASRAAGLPAKPPPESAKFAIAPPKLESESVKPSPEPPVPVAKAAASGASEPPLNDLDAGWDE